MLRTFRITIRDNLAFERTYNVQTENANADMAIDTALRKFRTENVRPNIAINPGPVVYIHAESLQGTTL